MVTLPGGATAQDIGAAAPEADASSASYRAALARGAAATDDGSDAGAGSDGAAGSGPRAAIDPLAAQRKLAGSAAEAAFLARKTALDDAAAGDPAPDTLRQRYGASLQAAATATVADLAPGDRGDFQSAIAPAVAAGQARVGALADTLSQQRDRDWLGAYANGLADQYARAADEPTRQALLDAGKVALRGMVQRGSLEPDAAQAQWQGLIAGATTARARLMVERDPAAFQDLAGNDNGEDGPEGGGAASVPPTNSWVDALPVEERARLLGQAASAIAQEDQAGAIERQRQAAAQQNALTQRARQASGAVLGQIRADPTAVDPFAIAKHPDLQPAQKAALGQLLSAELDRQGSGAAKTYGAAFWPLYQRINAADGDPGKVNDPDALIAAAGPGNGLSAAGADRLRQELDLRATPEGEAEATMKQRFLAQARAQIGGSDPARGIADADGDALFLKHLATAIPTYDAGRAAGKTPVELLDPDSADSIASSIPIFQRSAAEYLNVLDGRQAGSSASGTNLAANPGHDPPEGSGPTGDLAGAGPHPSPDTVHAAEQNVEKGAVVWLPNGETVPDDKSPTGKMMSPVDNLPQVAAAGRETGRIYKAMLANPDAAAGALPYLGGALLTNVATGGQFDYQRSAPSQVVGAITGFTQHPQFRPIADFNVGLFTQQAGLSREEALTIAGKYAHFFSSNANADQPYGIESRTRQFIEAGYDAGERGLFSPAAKP
jgi:hypothetical protein